MNTPEQTVKEYIIAYKKWNDDAASNKSRDDTDAEILAAMNAAKGAYNEDIIKPFCSASVIPQGVAYGSDSSHGPDEEEIIETVITDDKATVITKNTDSDDFVSDYKYLLENIDGEWKLTSVLYVCSDGEFEGL